MPKQQGSTGVPLNLFISYAHEDEPLRQQLETHLSLLQRQGLIASWHDRQILAGDDWAHDIDQHLEDASIILLLISADFLASNFQYDIEMKRAMERHKRGEARVIPIIGRPCDLQNSPFAHLQCLPRNTKPITTWDNQDEAFVAIVEELRKVIDQQYSPYPLLSNVQRQNRTRLLKRVRATWVKGLLEQSLHQAAWLDLRLQEQPDALENPWRFQVQEFNQAPYALPIGRSIVEIYDEANGELLLLGEPGSGKTTLLLLLARTLLDRAEADERLPVPVVFNLSSWGQKRGSLDVWLVEELSSPKYQVPREVAQRWVEANQILPLLDGLDEVADGACGACAQAITTYYHQQLRQAGTPLVLCCRSKEYQALSPHLPLQRAVSILPLTQEQINFYLSRTHGQLDGLRQALRDDAAFYELARRPLMLNIFTLAYQGATSVDLPVAATQEQILHVVFRSYVTRMLTRRGQLRPWKQEQFLHWLTMIARQMRHNQQTIFSVENIQPDWLTDSPRHLYYLSIKLFNWLIGRPLLVLIFMLAYAPFSFFRVTDSGIPPQLLSLLPLSSNGKVQLFGKNSMISRWFILAFYGQTEIEPVKVTTWSWAWKEIWGGLVFGLPLGLFIGLAYGLIFGLVGNVVTGLLLGLFGGVLGSAAFKRKGVLICGVVSGVIGGAILGPTDMLFFWLKSVLFWKIVLIIVLALWFSQILGRMIEENYLTKQVYLSPNENIWLSGKNGLIGGVLCGLVSGLACGLFFGLIGGVVSGVVFGLISGLMTGLDAFIQHFVLRFWLRSTNRLPWNLVPFLDEAAKRLLLRKVGGSYIFVHRLLFEYFATLETSSSKEVIAGSTLLQKSDEKE